MTTKDAKRLLANYNAWRRYDGPIGEGPTQPDPKDIGIAIDVVLSMVPDEPVSDDLEEAAKHYSEHTSFHWPNQVKPSYDAFKAGAEWQYQKDKTLIKKAHDCGFGAGSVWQKAKMMEGAIDIKVIESYNPACELNERLHGISFIYDCKNDNQYLIAGDRAKVIIVKEEEA